MVQHGVAARFLCAQQTKDSFMRTDAGFELENEKRVWLNLRERRPAEM
jgi:hypothetical protein